MIDQHIEQHDVIVVGGGPSGLNTARRLACSGLDVVVLEKKPEIGKNIVCTGVIGRDVFERYDLPADSILTELQDVRMISPFETSITYNHPEPFACVVDREKFDKNLAQVAKAEGADVRTGYCVSDVVINSKEAEVIAKTPGKESKVFKAKLIILATGVDYRLNKKLGLGSPRDYLNGAQAEFDIGDSAEPTIWVGKNTAPGAFAWSVPVSGRKVRIGLVTEKDPRAYFKKLVERAYPQIAGNLSEAHVKCKVIAQGIQKRTYGERVLAVGEAAGQVKTTTGGGVFFGLLCSEIASEVVLKKIARDLFRTKDLAEYEARWKKTIRRELMIGYYARKICGKLSDSELEKLFQLAKYNGVLPLIREMGKFDWHSDLILALARKAPVQSIQSIRSLWAGRIEA